MIIEDLLSGVYVALGKASAEGFERVFIDNPELTTQLYDRLSISGATFVVADSRHQKFILLQHGVPEAESYDVRLQLPIRRGSAGGPAQESEYNRFCNRIFQIQRAEQGLGAYQSRLLLSAVPEFLAGLPPEYVWSAERNDDWSHTRAPEMFRGLVAWRWLHWLIYQRGADTGFRGIDPGLHWHRAENPACADVKLLFEKTYLQQFDPHLVDQLPEPFIASLDHDGGWDETGPSSADEWRRLRERLDGAFTSAKTFEIEITRLAAIYGTPTIGTVGVAPPEENDGDYAMMLIKEIHEWLWEQICCQRDMSIAEALVRLHARVQFPIPSYFYFSILDEVPKEHLVVPVLRSDTYPLIYYVRGQRRSHTAVVSALASLNARREAEEDTRLRILGLKTILRICADRIIDAIFIKSLVSAERDRARERAENVLATCRYRNGTAIFILGSFGQRVTLLAQQSRALMLVRAMKEKSILDDACGEGVATVAVIGGGVGGVTAAAALATAGARVTLYEAADDVLTLQMGARHRFVHPTVANWPLGGSLVDDAGLPILDWSAGPAPQVMKQIRSRFDKIADLTGRIDVQRKKKIDDVEQLGSGGVRVSGTGIPPGGRHHVAAIVSIGFGLEKGATEGRSGHSYWEPDALEDFKVEKQTVLVLGDGDGALIDLARAALFTPDPDGNPQPFNQEIAIRRLTESAPFELLAKSIYEVDQRLARAAEYLMETLVMEYRRAFEGMADEARNQLMAAIRSLRRADSDVTYGFTANSILRPDTALVNRVLAFLILESGCAATIKAGRTKAIKPLPSGSILVEADFGSREFDIVVDRFGPSPTWLADSIRSLKDAADVLGGRLKELHIADELDDYTAQWYREKCPSHAPAPTYVPGRRSNERA